MRTLKHKIIRRLHLWLALPLALFLIVLGLTGSAITLMHELDGWLNPQLLHVVANDNETAQSASALLDRLNHLDGYKNPYMLTLPENKNEVLIAWYKVSQDKANQNIARQVMVNPYTGVILGERLWGEFGLSRPLLMPTLFHLHRYLLAGEIGKTLVSINGILLAIIALSGIYLWWPAWRLKAWWHAITVSRLGSWKHFNFRLHRTAGFYAAPIFLMLAFTGIYFNKPHWIMPVQKTATKKSLEQAQGQSLPLDAILRIAQNQFPDAKITRINLPKSSGTTYEIRFLQPDELRQRTGATRVSVNGVDGTIIKIKDPSAADGWELFSSYFFPLHSGEMFGVASKMFISLFGLMPLVFAVSGIVIWVNRRKTSKS